MFFETFREAVLYAADENGMLSLRDAQRAVRQHSDVTWEQWLRERPLGALPCEARPLLTWLGH